MLFLVILCGVENGFAYHWVRNYKIGDKFTVSTTAFGPTYSIDWNYDSDVVQPVSSIGKATSAVTFKVIGSTPSAGSVINAVTYYYKTILGQTGLFQDMDDWLIHVNGEGPIVLLDKDKLELDVGKSGSLTATLSNSGYSTKLKWSSSKPSVATVNGSGTKATVKANAVGRTTIKVSLDNGNYAECEVIVGGAPDPNKFTVTANPRGGVVSQGTTVMLTPSIEGAIIYYTTDGSTPTEDSEYYLSQYGVTIKESCTLKAIAIKRQYPKDKYSEVMTETYTMKEEPGYIFKAKTEEGVNMSFLVTNTSPKECHVYPEDAGSYRWAISTATTGTITIPSNVNGYAVVGVGVKAFCLCRNLVTVYIPGSVRTIDNSAFRDCSNLNNLVLPNSISTIGSYAFDGCSSLSSINIPSRVSSIGDTPFSECEALREITVDNGNPYYDSRENCNAIIKTATNTLIQGISTTVIPESVTSIAANAFAYCNLSSVVIPNKVTHIGSSAFDQCNTLETLTLGESVKSIGKYAFRCSSLTQVTSYIEEPFTIDKEVFKNASAATLYVPQRSKEKYESADGWKEFKEIVEMGDEPSVNTDIVVTVTNCSRIYGEKNPVFEYTVTGGTIQGEPVITCEATELSEVGSYDIKLSQGTVSSNVTFVNGTLTITKAPLKISAGSYTMRQGDPLPQFKVSYDGFKNNEGEDALERKPQLICDADKDSAPGTYPITVSGASAKNYTIEYVGGTLTILASITSDEMTVSTSSGGSLSSEIGSTSWKNIKSLTVSGQINGSDIRLIRKMLQEGRLEVLNLHDAEIVSGGDSYDIYGLSNTSEDVIGESMFYNCQNLRQIDLPITTQRIEDYAFFGCSGLKHLELPETCVEVGDYAVAFCDSLTSVKIPASIVRIGESAFTYCTSLSTIYSSIDNIMDVVSFDSYVSPFDGIADGCMWHVPNGTKNKYTSLSWWDRSWEVVEDWDSSTSMAEKVLANQAECDVWYTLRGEKLNEKPATPGIYVYRGNKVVIR